MLERVVGPQKALSRVTAELTFNRISTSEEVYDPDRTAIRSEQRLSEKNVGPAKGAEGIPQSSFELGTGNDQQDEAGPRGEVYERSEETTNYEITKINRQIITPAGDVKRLSVAVLVDGTYEEVVKEGNTTQTYIPRPQTEVDKLTELVKNAIGYDETRGDSVVVQSVPFYIEEAPAPGWWAMPRDMLDRYGRTALNVLLIVLFFLFIVRPILAWLRREVTPEAPPVQPMALPEGEGEAAELPSGRLEKGQLTRDQVLQLAQQDPERTVNLIRSWIDER
jgi:flagellar M-ring protein FliF